jgi:hypothetical protein
MSKKSDSSVDEQVKEMLSEEPQKPQISDEHKKIVSDTFKTLQDNGYSFWDAQQVTGLVIAAINTQDAVKALETAKQIAILFRGVDKVQGSALLQIMAEKINAQINKLSMSDIQIEEL